MVSGSSLANAPRERLRRIAKALQELHRALLEYQRRDYERSFGRIGSDFYVLKLAADDPQFAWLRALSAEMMRIDVALSSGGGDDLDLQLAGTRLRYLLTPTGDGTPFQSRYDAALQTNPDIVMAHAAVMRALPLPRRVTLFRSDPPSPVEEADAGVETRVHRPGELVPGLGDQGYRSLAAIVEVRLRAEADISPHRYANEDIVLWVTDGAVEHIGADGVSVRLDRDHLAVINAGTGAPHADRAAGGDARLVQVAVRPRPVHAEPVFQHGALPVARAGEWRQLVAPEEDHRPFTVRNAVEVYDAALAAGMETDLPRRDGWDTYVFVAQGAVEIDGVPVGASMGALLLRPGRAGLTVIEDALVLAVVIDPTTKITRTGSVGR